MMFSDFRAVEGCERERPRGFATRLETGGAMAASREATALRLIDHALF